MPLPELTDDAVLFGMAYLNGPKSRLFFGGADAKMEITPRAEAALQNLIQHGFCEPCQPDTMAEGRRAYRGIGFIGDIAKERIKNPFDQALAWPTFVKKEP